MVYFYMWAYVIFRYLWQHLLPFLVVQRLWRFSTMFSPWTKVPGLLGKRTIDEESPKPTCCETGISKKKHTNGSALSPPKNPAPSVPPLPSSALLSPKMLWASESWNNVGQIWWIRCLAMVESPHFFPLRLGTPPPKCWEPFWLFCHKTCRTSIKWLSTKYSQNSEISCLSS